MASNCNAMLRAKRPAKTIGPTETGAKSQTVAIGVTGEPTAPGSRNGGAVSMKRLR